MLPPAPARFSTITCWPMFSARNFATTRATVSVPPPGSKPTTIVIGLDGKFCAVAKQGSVNAKAATRNLILLPREYRFAFLHEGLASFLVVRALEAFLGPRPALGGVVVHSADLADDALGGAHGERRIAGDHLGVFGNRLLQIGNRNYFVHQAHVFRLGCRELPRGDHDLARVGGADDLHQVLHRRGPI